MGYYYNEGGYGNGGGGFLSFMPPVTKHILIINVLMFLATLANQDFMIRHFALFYPESPLFRWWQPITHMFMHGGFWHIFFNMYTLMMFGIVVEKRIGSKKFITFYLITGLGAALLFTGVQALEAASWQSAANSAAAAKYYNLLSTPMLGASGAIYGVLIGFAMMYPDSRMMLLFPPVELSAKWMVIIFIGIELVTGVTGTADGVAHFAHLGGALFGWLLMLWWKKSGRIWETDDWI